MKLGSEWSFLLLFGFLCIISHQHFSDQMDLTYSCIKNLNAQKEPTRFNFCLYKNKRFNDNLKKKRGTCQSNYNCKTFSVNFYSFVQFSVKYGCAIACSALIRIFGTQTNSFCSKSRPLEFNRGTT